MNTCGVLVHAAWRCANGAQVADLPCPERQIGPSSSAFHARPRRNAPTTWISSARRSASSRAGAGAEPARGASWDTQGWPVKWWRLGPGAVPPTSACRLGPCGPGLGTVAQRRRPATRPAARRDALVEGERPRRCPRRCRAGMNFSYWVFKERGRSLGWFRRAHAGLAPTVSCTSTPTAATRPSRSPRSGTLELRLH